MLGSMPVDRPTMPPRASKLRPAVLLPHGVGVSRFDQIEAELTRALFRNCPVGVIGAAIVAVMLAEALHGPSAHAAVVAYQWSAMVGVCAVAHLLLCFKYRQCAPSDSDWRRWNWAFTAIVIVEGGTWCFGAVQFLADGNAFRALVALLAWAGVISAAIVVFGAFLRTYLAFITPAMIPHIVFLLDHPYPFSDTVLALILIYTAILPIIVFSMQRQIVEAHRLRFENLELAIDMRQQKERADHANRAKSSFLAAASHDLRQPVHALGLFIGALRSRAMDDEARRLVDHIDESVGAMDDLFASLLDISKLDAGTVTATPVAVAIGPLLARLCSSYSDEAAAKGISLRWVGSSLTVLSDPVLLERILRNLISNAIRYTDVGGIVAGCRRSGSTITAEIWDSGCGIAADQHDLIFQEFFQVGNPERDRSKGLGLGLAIVRRLSILIDARLELRSEIGRGSVFALALPRCDSEPISDNSERRGTLQPGDEALILVIDDEVAIQRAMESLLLSWGYRVVVSGSGEELMSRLTTETGIPDLIICDYRLRGDETGVAVIDALRAHLGRLVPAMLITGDTAPERIAEAQASGFLLLHKPLSNARLRAAVGNLQRGHGR